MGRTDLAPPRRSFLADRLRDRRVGARRPARVLAGRPARPPRRTRRSQQTTMREDDAEPPRRHLRPERRRRPRDDDRARAPRRDAVRDRRRSAASEVAAELVAHPRPERRRRRPADRPRDAPTGSTSSSPTASTRTIAGQIRAAITSEGRSRRVALEPEPVRVYPQAGGGPDTTLAAQLLGFVNRDGVGQYGVEQYYQDAARRAAADRPGPARRRRAGRSRTRAVVERSGHAGRGPPPDDRRRPPARRRAGDPRRVGRRPGQVASRRVVMDPYTGEILAEATYPSYDGERLRSDRGRATRPASSTRSSAPSTSRARSSRCSPRRRPRDATTVTTQTQIKDTGHPQARRRPDPHRRRRPQGDGLDDVRGRDRLLAQRRRGEGRARRSTRRTRQSSAILHSTWTRFGFGAPTGIDLAGEVGGIVRDPAITAVAPDRPRERRVRPGRRGHADPARDGLRRDGQRRHARPAARRRRRSASERTASPPRAR